MLTGLGLRNFKAFGDEMQEAPMSKITLIYGPNSGGKSSVIQALLLLKQSLRDNYSTHDPLTVHLHRPLVFNGDFVDLLSFQTLLHKHDIERELGISLRYYRPRYWDNIQNEVSMTFKSTTFKYGQGSPRLTDVRYKITSDDRSKPLFDAEVDITFPDIGWRFRVIDICWDSEYVRFPGNTFLPLVPLPEMNGILKRERARPERTEKLELEMALSLELERIRARIRELELELEPELTGKRLLWLKLDLANELELAREREVSLALERLLIKLNLSTIEIHALTPKNFPDNYDECLNLINYLGPLRSAPQRLYKLSNENDDSAGITGIQGGLSADALYHSEEVRDAVNDWFERFEIPYELSVINLGEAFLAGEHITVALTDKRTDTQVTLTDVGYGINQLLPVIIEGVASQEGSILCVEQPEIHLHPRLQANIADLMIDTIADEWGKRKQWIVETHSELLITRLQRRIREGKIKSEDISVLYVDPDDEHCEGSAIIKLRLDENGDFIDHWPHGFFDEAFNELMAAPEPVSDDVSTLPVNVDKSDSATAPVQPSELLDE